MSLNLNLRTVRKKALIITYYWPPAGGPGVQRWLKFVKYLPDYNIEPIVYCPENPSYPILDDSLISEVSKDITVLKQPIKEPYRFAKLISKSSSNRISSGVIPKHKKQSFIERLLIYIRGNYFIPDARKNWIKPSVSFLSDYIQENNIKTIITTGPPHSLHLIGLQLKLGLDISWIADFRDPWTTIGYHKKLKLTKASQQKHKRLEHKVINTADQLIVTSNNTKKSFEEITNQPISVITNGYDSHNIQKQKKDSKFTISHIGSLLSDRNPEVLWEVIGELLDENVALRDDLQLQFFGVVSDDVLKSVYDFKLKAFTKVFGYVNHEDAIKAQMKSQLLLLIEINSEETKAIIPGKLFEYIVSGTPILSMGPINSDIEYIVKSTNTGCYYGYDEKQELKSQILSYFNAYKANSLYTQPIGLQQYSRKVLTKTLAELI